MGTTKRDCIVGWEIFSLCAIAVIANAYVHSWWVIAPLIGLFGSAAGLWYNGSINGMEWMRKTWNLP